jgi:Uma2 family endonuclease
MTAFLARGTCPAASARMGDSYGRYTSSVQSARRLATYDDLLALPEGVRAEVIEGALVTPPSPLPRHARVQGALSGFLGGPFDRDDGRGGPGGSWILAEVDVRLERHTIVRPDVSGWRRERLPSPWDARPIDVVPDWVCEILSPSTAALDRVKKRDLYAKHGVPFFWLVDPHARTLEALRLQRPDGPWVEVGAYDDDSVARIAPFEAIELEVGRLFPPGEREGRGNEPT